MSVCSLAFFVALAVLAVIFQLVSNRSARRLLLFGGNLAFASTYIAAWQTWVALGVFLVATYGMIWLSSVRPRRGLVAASVALIVAFYLLQRYAVPLNQWHIIGISYMLFKAIHALVDTSQGQLVPGGFFCYLNYQLSFFTLVAGPIQRYGDFQAFWASMDGGPPTADHALSAWSRILTGLLKNGAMGPLVWHACLGAPWAVGSDLAPGTRFLGQFYGYPIWLYFNFSGYCDVMIGAAKLLGCEAPENFNYPFLARNVIDYWNRWHITLSRWIRDYVFMTSYKAAAERYPRHAQTAGYALLFASLLLAGVWHGSTFAFVAFGALHGLGATANEIGSHALKRLLGREGAKRYHQNRWIRAWAIAVTFHFTCFCLLFFALQFRQASFSVRDFWHWVADQLSHPRMRWPIMVSAASLLMLAPLIARLGIESLEGPATGDRPRMAGGEPAMMANATTWGFRFLRSAPARYGRVAAKTILVALMFVVFWVLNQQDPVVVYQGF